MAKKTALYYTFKFIIGTTLRLILFMKKIIKVNASTRTILVTICSKGYFKVYFLFEDYFGDYFLFGNYTHSDIEGYEIKVSLLKKLT